MFVEDALRQRLRIIIIIVRRLIIRGISEYMTEPEAWAVARWEVGSCSRMVSKTKQVVLSRCLKVCTVGAFLMAAGISFQILGAQYLKARLPKSVVTVGTLIGC